MYRKWNWAFPRPSQPFIPHICNMGQLQGVIWVAHGPCKGSVSLHVPNNFTSALSDFFFKYIQDTKRTSILKKEKTAIINNCKYATSMPLTSTLINFFQNLSLHRLFMIRFPQIFRKNCNNLIGYLHTCTHFSGAWRNVISCKVSWMNMT